MKYAILTLIFIIGILLTIFVASFDTTPRILRNLSGKTFEEAEQELIDSINEAVKAGKDVNVSFEPPTNALLYTRAVGLDSAKALNLLIENGLEIHAPNNRGDTQLHWAAQCGSVKTARILIEKGIDVDSISSTGRTPLFYAAKADENQKEIVNILIDAGANVNAKSSGGTTPLTSASYSGNIDAVTILLETGAKINEGDNNGWTPLHLAARLGHIETVKLLIEKGADVNAVKSDGGTPLSCAKESVEKEGASWTGKRKAAKYIQQNGGK